MSNKLKSKNKIADKINDMKLKECFADEAIAMLLNYKHIEQKNLQNITVEYGFLYKFGKRGYSSLFKVITRNRTFYFGVTEYELSLICFTEDLFVKTANDFLKRQGKNYDYTQQNNIIAIG